MKAILQFVTTPTSDTSGTTIFVQNDRKTYVFGSAGEGIQRATVEQGARLAKVSEIFISGRTEWVNVGGLIGLMLTMADSIGKAAVELATQTREAMFRKETEHTLSAEEYKRREALLAEKVGGEKPSLTIFGPSGLNYMLATARRFVFRTGIPLDVHDVPTVPRAIGETGPATQLFKDDFIRVWSLNVSPASSVQHPRSERKRSHEEMEDAQPSLDAVDRPQTAYQLLRSVVGAMFNSDWQFDRLYESKLGVVQMPAQLFIRDPVTNRPTKYTGPLAGQPGYEPDTIVLSRAPWPSTRITKRLPAPEVSKASVSYIVRNWPQRGKFDPAKALALGLTDRKTFTPLTEGKPQQNDKGETITPDMVLGPTKPATGFVVADLPTVDYVKPFIDHIKEVPDDTIGGIAAYCWILGHGVFQDAALQEFLSTNSNVEHFVAGPEVCQDRLTFEKVAAMTLRMSAADPTRYKVPFVAESPAPIAPPLASHVKIAEVGLAYQLEPVTQFETTKIKDPIDIQAALQDIDPKVKAAAERAAAEVKLNDTAQSEWAANVPDPDAEVITLGTGSSQPSKYRNVSSTLVRVPGWGNILLDVGENTVGQLRRMYSPDEFSTIMRELRCIWISHLHADHHLGIASLIKSWYHTVHDAIPGPFLDASAADFNPAIHFNDSPPRLSIMSDEPMLHWLFEYSQLEDIGFSRCTPICVSPNGSEIDGTTALNWFVPPPPAQLAGTETTPLPPQQLPARIQRLRTRVSPYALNLANVQACYVQHCVGAMAVSLTLPSGFKLSYSGDCRPSRRFALQGKGTTLLVHEATFDDELKGDALAKRHSTTGEALRIGAEMGAKAVVLTHFSQRYAKVPVLEHEDEAAQDALSVLEKRDAAATASAASVAAAAAAAQQCDVPRSMGDDDDDDDEDMELVDPEQAARPSADDGDGDGDGDGGATAGAGKMTFKLHANKDMKVCIAYDYMRVRIGDMPQMEKYAPVLVALDESDQARAAAEKQAALQLFAQKASKKKNKKQQQQKKKK